MGNLKYARKCNNCGCGMNEGYCIENGEEYYCTETCLTQQIPMRVYLMLHDEGGSYWTAWEKNDFRYEKINGKLVEIEK